MLARAFDTLCLRALGSSTLGWVVRTLIVLTDTETPRRKAVDDRAMVPVR